MRIPSLTLAALLLASGTACSAPPSGQRAGVRAQLISSEVEAPVALVAPPGDARLFVVEQPGRIRIVRDGRLAKRPFLDLTRMVSYRGERGLLGLAFHPQYARNGVFVVNYTDREGDTRIVRYRVSADPDSADPGSAREIMRIEQPFGNHNGGTVVFGPDSMLWIGMGDGGSGGDPRGYARNPRSLLGKMLRIDIDRGAPYAIPRDNPHADGREALPEIWARGLRNPWKFSFDRRDGTLWIADVGQNQWEEIDAVDPRRGGLDFGWNLREGRHPFGSGTASAQGMTDPVYEYSHDEGCSVTGGFVYRGRAIPALRGHYVFSDYCSGRLESIRLEAGRVVEHVRWDAGALGSVSGFGEDAAGELHVLDHRGRILRLVPAAAAR